MKVNFTSTNFFTKMNNATSMASPRNTNGGTDSHCDNCDASTIQDRRPYIFFKSSKAAKPQGEMKITEEDVRKVEEAGAEFLKSASEHIENNEDIEAEYHNYWQFLQDGYFAKEGLGLYLLREQWSNGVNSPIQSVIYMLEHMPESVNVDELSQYIAKTGELFEIHRLLYQDGEPNNNTMDRIDIKKTFDIALDIAKKQLGNRKITVRTELLDEIGVDFDQYNNYIIFSKLLSNAIKNSPDGSEIKVIFSKENMEHIHPDDKLDCRFYDDYFLTAEGKGIGVKPDEQSTREQE